MKVRMFTWRVLLTVLTAGLISVASMSCGGKVEQQDSQKSEAEEVKSEHPSDQPAADEAKTEHQEHPE